MLLEVFRAGNPAADAEGITAADLADVAAFDCGANPVPHVLGHPQTDTPALGPVRGFKAEGASLFADLDETHNGFAKVVAGVKAGSILNRSMQFFGKHHRSNPTPGKLAPKHLGWLGGAAPGIPGMPALAKALAFADGELIEATGDPAAAVVLEPAPTPVISFSEAAPAAQSKGSSVTAEEIAEREKQIAERERLADEREKSFAASADTARKGETAAAVKALVAEGKILPADEADAIAAFAALDNEQTIEFSSDKATVRPALRLLAIMAKGGKVAPVNEKRESPTGEAPSFSANDGELEKARADRRARYGK